MKKTRWNPLHPEHMVPGSFWRLKDQTSLYYLENYYGDDDEFFWTSATFDFEKVYFLVKIEEKNSFYIASFLDEGQLIERSVNKSCWDNAFELVRGSTNPQEPKKMFLGRISFEEFSKKFKL